MTSKYTHLINKKASNKNIMNSCDWFLPTKMLSIRLELNMAHPSWYCLKKLRKKKKKVEEIYVLLHGTRTLLIKM